MLRLLNGESLRRCSASKFLLDSSHCVHQVELHTERERLVRLVDGWMDGWTDGWME